MTSRLADPGDLGTAVGVILRVARMHGSSISVKDLLQLLPDGTRQEDVVTALTSLPGLAAEYTLRGGLIVPQLERSPGKDDYDRRLAYSRASIRTARWLASKVGGRSVLTISVSGSTSYRAAAKGDDVDLFCITASGTMWVFLAKALLFTRISRLLRRDAPPICLSCIMDEDYARSLFAKDRGALFARDALMTEVVKGEEHYAWLVNLAPWMERYFPRLYALRRATSEGDAGPGEPVSLWLKSVNLFLFLTLGAYVRAKAHYHNRLLSRRQNPLISFRALVGIDHLVYESAKYLRLREMYDEIRLPSARTESR